MIQIIYYCNLFLILFNLFAGGAILFFFLERLEWNKFRNRCFIPIVYPIYYIKCKYRYDSIMYVWFAHVYANRILNYKFNYSYVIKYAFIV